MHACEEGSQELAEKGWPAQVRGLGAAWLHAPSRSALEPLEPPSSAAPRVERVARMGRGLMGIATPSVMLVAAAVPALRCEERCMGDALVMAPDLAPVGCAEDGPLLVLLLGDAWRARFDLRRSSSLRSWVCVEGRAATVSQDALCLQ